MLERLRYAERTQNPTWAQARNKRENGRKVRKRYGLTEEQREALLAAQDGLCGICGKPTNFGGQGFKTAHVDHCHSTGRVRGVLCGVCNTALGKLGDTVEAIERVLSYLKRGI